MVPIFFSPGDSHTKGLLVLLHLGLEGITEVDSDTKGRFESFKVTPSNDKVICVYAPSGYRGRFFEGLNILWKIKMKEMKTKYIWRL